MSDEAVTIDGFCSHTPALALASGDYPIELYNRLRRWEEKRFWFRAKYRIIFVGLSMPDGGFLLTVARKKGC